MIVNDKNYDSQFIISYQIDYNCLTKVNKLRFKDNESVRLSVDYSDEARAIKFNGNLQITFNARSFNRTGSINVAKLPKGKTSTFLSFIDNHHRTKQMVCAFVTTLLNFSVPLEIIV